MSVLYLKSCIIKGFVMIYIRYPESRFPQDIQSDIQGSSHGDSRNLISSLATDNRNCQGQKRLTSPRQSRTGSGQRGTGSGERAGRGLQPLIQSLQTSPWAKKRRAEECCHPIKQGKYYTEADPAIPPFGHRCGSISLEQINNCQRG